MTQEEARRQEQVAEAVLFAMGRSVEVRQLAAAMECEPEEARAAAERLREQYDAEGRAMKIIELDGSYQMCSRKEYFEALVRVVKVPKKPVLTETLMETLSIIAYRQPVTRTEIEAIRGVSSDYAVNKLIEFGLVNEAGRLDAPGKPMLFATTEEFLRRFGVVSRQDLPDLDADTEAEIIHEVEKEMGFHGEEEAQDGDPDQVLHG